jgi:lipopolysaccharide export system protein LptA
MTELFAVLATAALVAAIWLSGSSAKSGENVVTAENQIYLEGVTFSRMLDGGDFAVVTAELAYLSRNHDLAVLENTTIRIEGEDTLFTSRADKGQYVFDKFLSSSGRIEGVYNDLSYSAADGGSFVYDFADGRGVLRENVTVRQKGSVITAASVFFDYAENSVLFDGAVTLSVNGGL